MTTTVIITATTTGSLSQRPNKPPVPVAPAEQIESLHWPLTERDRPVAPMARVA